MIEVGQKVRYRDQHGIDHDALVTEVHGDSPGCPVNLVYVSKDESRRDAYGRQLLRDGSVVHTSMQTANGNFWKEG